MKRKAFGELENAVMALLMKKGHPLSVRDIHQAIGQGRAYTTLLTVVSRLYEKGVLSRQKEGRSFVYLLKKSKKNTLFQKVKKHLFSASPPEVMSYFLDNEISEEDVKKIEQMIQQYKRKKQ